MWRDAAEGSISREPVSVTNPGSSCVLCMAGRPSRLSEWECSPTASHVDGAMGRLLVALCRT